MTHRPIEHYSEMTSLVEDFDGIRLLLTDSPVIRMADWDRAEDAGAAAIIVYEHDRIWHWVTTERFEATRIEHTFAQTYEATGLVRAPGLPSFRDMVVNAPPPPPPSGFVHLHAHSEFSALDGLSTVQEMVTAAVDDGQPGLAVTDHGVCSAHPQLSDLATKAGIRPVFGIEAYMVDDRAKRGPTKPTMPTGTSAADKEQRLELLTAHEAAKKEANDYHHLILWAENDVGLRNLWAASTAAYREGFYRHPRLDWEVLQRHSEGVLCSTGCLRGPLAVPILRDDEERARANLARLLGIFGDRLYAEIHTNGLADQHRANAAILDLATEFGIPSIAAVDSHYPCASDYKTHQVWLAAQTNSDLTGDADLFSAEQEYHLMTAAEARSALDYLPADRVAEAMANTVTVAERCTAALTPRLVMPIYTQPGNYLDDRARIQADIDRLQAVAVGTAADHFANMSRRCGGKRHPLTTYWERYATEMDLLVAQGYVGYFLMTWRQVRFAKDQGILVGPGRGSGSGSLVAYLLGITEIDPVDADLLFERFLTEGRNEPPDFDVDYPTSTRDLMQDFCTEEWGADHTMRVGTNLRLKSRGVVQNLGRIYKEQVDYRDFLEVSKIIDRAEAGEAGLGMSWEDLWTQYAEELDPYRARYPDIFGLADRLHGRLKSYGQHAAGMVISPDEVLTNNLPMRMTDKSVQPISQFDMDALTLLGYIKFDLLTLRTLDTLQQTVDLIAKRRGDTIAIYDWREEYDDPQVWDEICDGNTLGIFQIETRSGTKLTKRFKPRSVAELADVITLVRPGPVRSGLTDAYFRRREGTEDLDLPDPRLADVLAPTQGVIIYQEQVMKACQVLGGYTLTEADGIRKILGKKQKAKVEKAGKEFISRCAANGMTKSNAEHLWDQLGEFAKYSFNKSHAWAYAVMGLWTAWFKYHYPIEFMTAVLSTVDKKRIPEFTMEARRMGYGVLPPDINDSGDGFTASPTACRYGFSSIEGLAAASTEAIMVGQPYTSFEDFMARKGKAANRGHVKTLVAVGAFDSLGVNRRQLMARLEWEDDAQSSACVNLESSPGTLNEFGLPCTFDWSSEPVVLGKSGRPLKAKPPPKRCTKACRQYTAPPEPAFDGPDYTEEEVQVIEKELLGVHLTSTPFDLIDPADLDLLATGMEVDNGPARVYDIAAIITRVKTHQSRNGQMAFVGMYAQDLELDVTVFSDSWTLHRHEIAVGHLSFAKVNKNARGITLIHFVPCHKGKAVGNQESQSAGVGS